MARTMNLANSAIITPCKLRSQTKDVLVELWCKLASASSYSHELISYQCQSSQNIPEARSDFESSWILALGPMTPLSMRLHRIRMEKILMGKPYGVWCGAMVTTNRPEKCEFHYNIGDSLLDRLVTAESLKAKSSCCYIVRWIALASVGCPFKLFFPTSGVGVSPAVILCRQI